MPTPESLAGGGNLSMKKGVQRGWGRILLDEHLRTESSTTAGGGRSFEDGAGSSIKGQRRSRMIAGVTPQIL